MATPFFKSLLEADHESTVIGARQALSLISELGCHEKFEGDISAPEEMKAETEVKENGHVSKISEGDTSAQEEMNVQTVVKENGHALEIYEVDTSALEKTNVQTVVKVSFKSLTQ
nr:hypothetical protein [Tanacetum cinerariifolium]